MPELDADFIISNDNQLETEYELGEGQHFDCSFEIFASGTVWGSITGDIENQTDLNDALNSKADANVVEQISETIGSYGDIVTHDVDEFATAEQGLLADTALQSGDNITELVNNAGYITSSALDEYATTNELTEGLATKQDTISDLSDIRSNASKGADAYDTIQGYGDIVTYNADYFATSIQGGLADTALQPNDSISELVNDVGYITSASLPTVNNSTITFQKNGVNVDTITLNQASNDTINYNIPTKASDINALSDTITINDLTTTAQQSALNSNITSTLTSQITTNKNNIEDIQDVIPSAATSSNQLTDKNFVNSSIATNTAYFIGTFTSVAELEAYSGTLTNNDYAFVETTDTAGNTLYDRYKYTTATTPASWQFEYELNNSSFTSNQWAAINSGANTTNIGQITTNANDIIRIDSIIGGYGDIVSYNASAFATSVQGGLADTALQPGDSISELVNNSGYITGITSSDVTNALGYTPYNSSNPNGFITDVKLNNVSVISEGVANIDLTGVENIELFDKYNYLSNASNTRIDTEITPEVDDIEIELKARCSTGSWYIFQSRETSSATTYGISGSQSGNTINFQWGGVALQSTITRTSDRHTLTIKATAKNGEASLYVKDEDTGTEDTQTGTYTTPNYPTAPFGLWGNYANQTVSSNSNCYYAKMKVGGVLVMDYTPAQRNGVVGFYDTATNSLKTPTVGTATIGSKNGEYIATTGLQTVAKTGSYNDLTNKPVPPIAFGASTTAASTVEKVVSIPEITSLNTGQVIVVQPTKSATVANLTIKLNSFPAYPILYTGSAITTSTDNLVWNANQPSAFVFNGTNWLFLCHGLDSNTTYSTMSVAEGVAGTATSNRSLQAANLKQIIQGTTLTGLDTITGTPVTESDSITGAIGKLQVQVDTKQAIIDANNLLNYAYLDNTPTIPGALSDITVEAGSNISINGDTISATDTTYSDFIGADSVTGGTSGLVPAPSAGNENRFLKVNGTWDTISGGGGGANTDLSNLTATGEAHFQVPLVSGTNIKTINNSSILGSGDLTVTASLPATGSATKPIYINSSGVTTVCTGIQKTWIIPNYNSLTTISSLPWTAPSDCFAFVSVERNGNTSTDGYITVNGSNVIAFKNISGYTAGSATAQLFLKQGDKINCSSSASFKYGRYCSIGR